MSLRNLWTVLTGGDNTQHSCYGTGAQGCAQVENPVQGGPQGTSDGNNTLYKYENSVLVTKPATMAK
jgi:filamentous hemagglutinin